LDTERSADVVERVVIVDASDALIQNGQVGGRSLTPLRTRG
jgi:hypothetical protein